MKNTPSYPSIVTVYCAVCSLRRGRMQQLTSISKRIAREASHYQAGQFPQGSKFWHFCQVYFQALTGKCLTIIFKIIATRCSLGPNVINVINQCNVLGEGKGDLGPQELNYDQIKKAEMPLTQDRGVALLALPPESGLLQVVSKSYQEQSICQINRYWGSDNRLRLVTAGER